MTVALKGTVLMVASLAATLCTGGWSEARESPTQLIRATVTEVVAIVSHEAMKQPSRAAERRRRLEDVIGARFSYDEMSKRTLTVQWKRLSEAEQAEFVRLFRSLLSDRYADKIEGYSGEDVAYLAERIDGTYAEVRTRLSSSKVEFPIDYRLLARGEDWVVYDVVIDGVSLVRNYRGQFEKIMRESSYAEFVRRLRERTKVPNTKGELG